MLLMNKPKYKVLFAAVCSGLALLAHLGRFNAWMLGPLLLLINSGALPGHFGGIEHKKKVQNLCITALPRLQYY